MFIVETTTAAGIRGEEGPGGCARGHPYFRLLLTYAFLGICLFEGEGETDYFAHVIFSW